MIVHSIMMVDIMHWRFFFLTCVSVTWFLSLQHLDQSQMKTRSLNPQSHLSTLRTKSIPSAMHPPVVLMKMMSTRITA
jgi:hypothetical protein